MLIEKFCLRVVGRREDGNRKRVAFGYIAAKEDILGRAYHQDGIIGGGCRLGVAVQSPCGRIFHCDAVAVVDRPFGVGKSHVLPAAAVRGRRFSVAAADKAENTEYQ